MALSRRTGGTDAVEFLFEINDNLAWPTGVASGDLAVVAVSWYESSDYTVSTPSGFTSRGSFVISGSGSTENRVHVFTKECDGTESGNLQIVISGSTYATATLDVFDGTNTLTYASISTADTGSGSDATAPSVSGTAGQGLVCFFALNDPPGTTNSDPSGMTLGANGTLTTNGVRTYYQDVTSTGATGTKTWDFTNTRDWAGLSMLIDGASAGGGGGGGSSDGIQTYLKPLRQRAMRPRLTAPGRGR